MPSNNAAIDFRQSNGGDISDKRGLVILEFLRRKGLYEVFKNSQLKDLPSGIRIRAPLSFFEPFKDNPRKWFDPQIIKELGESIKKRGDVEKPVHVTMRWSKKRGFYLLIIDGESRFRAASNIDLTRMSCFLHPSMSDAEVYLMSAKANAGRSQLTPIEEAHIIIKLEREYGMTNKQIADELSKSVTTISHTRKYLTLHRDLQEALLKREITKGEALAIATVEKNRQGDALKAVRQKIAEKGKGLTQNELAIVVRQFKEKHGIRSNEERKRVSRPESSAADLKINRIMRISDDFIEELETLRKLKKKEIVSSSVNIIDLIEMLDTARKRLIMQLNRLDKFAE